MGLGGLASALAKGINGYTRGTMLKDEKERQDKEDAFKEKERARKLKTWEREDNMHQGLADAIRPAQVDTGYQVTDDAGSNAFTKDADAAAVMQDMAGTVNTGAGLSQATRVNQTAYTDPALAKKAATEYDSTAARYGRAALATIPNDPTKGLQLQTSADAAAKAAREHAKMMQVEGVGDAYRGILARDPQAIADGFNKSGTLRIEGLPKLVETRKVKTPFGEVDDDVWEATVVGADGAKRTVRQSAYQVGMQLYDVKDLLKDQTEAQKMGLSHVRKLAETKARGEEDRKTEGAKVRTTGAANNLNREERLRYTSLFNEAGRRMSEARQALSKLQGDDVFMLSANKPGTAQAQQLQSLNDAIKSYAEERSTYQKLLAQSQLPEEAGLSNAAPGPASAPESSLRPKASGDMGAAPGARDREIAQAKADLQRTTDPDARRLLQDHIAQMEAQNARYGSKPAAKTALSVGQVVNGYRFKGGNPNDKANWSKVN